jgi:CheY-like chemotaxis protein
MAKILISEPHDDVRMLLIAMAARLGHEPVSVEAVATVPTDAQVLVFEPAEPGSLEHAQTQRRKLPDQRLVCVSIKPPEPEWLELGPSAYVVKPFSLASLQSALTAATLTLQN